MSEVPVVYVIDDDDAVRDSLCMLLEHCGFAVRSYASSAAFLHDAPEVKNGSLLVDVNMPGMTGPELLDHLRQRGTVIPAILMTGGITTRIQPAVDRIGATVLQKPFQSGELVACIETVLGRYRA